MRVTKKFKWHCAHRLMNHKGLCKNLHGHTYKLEIEVEGKINKNGMIVDFSDLKQFVKTLVIDKFDHATILNDKDTELIKCIQKMKLKLLVMYSETTVENMVTWIWETLELPFVHQVKWILVRVRLYETDTSYAEKRWNLND